MSQTTLLDILQELSKFTESFLGKQTLFIPCEKEAHGDLTTHIAFLLAKERGCSPVSIAQDIVEILQSHPLVDEVSSVGGFVNVTLSPSVWLGILKSILEEKEHYGKSTIGNKHRVNVEYVSANPTGPLHAGHARIAIVGDVIANLLEAVGYAVTREYLVNDAGNQISILARSVQAYCIGLLENTPVTLEEGLYPGEYVKDVAESFVKKHLEKISDLHAVGRFATHYLLTEILEELELFNITFDQVISEYMLRTEGLIQKGVDILEKSGYVYEGVLQRPKGREEEVWEENFLLLFRSTVFGDDQDRPLRKNNGEWTYFAAEVGYRLDQYQRGFKSLISVWGADHASHVLRTQAIVSALTKDCATLEVILCQMVNFLDRGQPIKMSKRAGTFVTLRDILEHIDPDALRFTMISKKSDTHFDFDFETTKEKTKDNPVFYVQYAHARCCSVLRAAEDLGFSACTDIDLSLLLQPHITVIKIMADWPRQVLLAAQHREPHRITTYLYRLATAFHALWHEGKTHAYMRFIQPDHNTLTHAQLSLVCAVRITLAAGLRLLGMTPREEMR